MSTDYVYWTFTAAAQCVSTFVALLLTGYALVLSQIEAAREHDLKVIVEQGIVGREVECGVLGGHGTDAPTPSEVAEGKAPKKVIVVPGRLVNVVL